MLRSFLKLTSRPALLLTLLVGATLVAQAQGPGGGTTGGPPPPTPPATTVPLDGGASLLLAGGVALGLRKLRQRRQKAA